MKAELSRSYAPAKAGLSAPGTSDFAKEVPIIYPQAPKVLNLHGNNAEYRDANLLESPLVQAL